MCINRVVDAGRKLVNKSDHRTSFVVKNLHCSASLLCKSNFDSIEMRAAFVTDIHSCERIGEIARGCNSVLGCCLKTDWSMEKSSQQKLVYLYPDYEQYHLSYNII